MQQSLYCCKLSASCLHVPIPSRSIPFILCPHMPSHPLTSLPTLSHPIHFLSTATPSHTLQTPLISFYPHHNVFYSFSRKNKISTILPKFCYENLQSQLQSQSLNSPHPWPVAGSSFQSADGQHGPALPVILPARPHPGLSQACECPCPQQQRRARAAGASLVVGHPPHGG